MAHVRAPTCLVADLPVLWALTVCQCFSSSYRKSSFSGRQSTDFWRLRFSGFPADIYSAPPKFTHIVRLQHIHAFLLTYVVVVVIAHQLQLFFSCHTSSWLRKWWYDESEEGGYGVVCSRWAGRTIVGYRRRHATSRLVVDVLSTANQPAVGSTYLLNLRPAEGCNICRVADKIRHPSLQKIVLWLSAVDLQKSIFWLLTS